MVKAHPSLQQVEGLGFYRLMGTGAGLGFSLKPDWGVYILLQVWKSKSHFNNYYESSELVKEFKKRTSEMMTVFMRPLKAHGYWGGENPFQISSDVDQDNPYISVVTRASIKPSKMWHFWRYVPTSQKPVRKLDGLLFTKGMGEFPLKEMATFSVWENKEALNGYAYRSKEHMKAIRMTKELNWYSEEMFSRFQPYNTIGSFTGLHLPF